MKKSIGKAAIVLLLIASIGVSLTACGSKFDASSYVKAMLDAGYLEQYDGYIENVGTQEEAEAFRESVLDNAMSGLNESGVLSEDMSGNFRLFFSDLLKKANYTVGEAQKDGDNYLVEVTYRPFTALDILDDDEALNEAVMEKIPTDQEDLYSKTEDELMALYMEGYLAVLNEQLATAEYGDEASITLRVEKGSGGTYSINEDDMYSLDSALFNMDISEPANE